MKEDQQQQDYKDVEARAQAARASTHSSTHCLKSPKMFHFNALQIAIIAMFLQKYLVMLSHTLQSSAILSGTQQYSFFIRATFET